MVKYQVYFMNNDGQKEVLDTNLSYEKAVEKWQYYNTYEPHFGCNYEPMNPR